MKQLSIMIKPASALCNLRCKYCFYADVSDKRTVKSSGIMKIETMKAMLDNIEAELESGDCVRFLFQGGEPTLAGIDFFEEFIKYVEEWEKDIKVSYALQTNATLLDEKWCEFLKNNNFLLGVSLDILQEDHDFVRVDERGNGTYKRILKTIQMLEEYGVEYNILCTLTNSIARHPKQVWNKIKQLKFQYIQFTPCLGELDSSEASQYELTPKRFAEFYIQLFKLWLEDYRKGKYISIKFFDDCLNLMVLRRPTSCGMNGPCQPQIVVEADGSVYPCDFYCVDEYKLGNFKEQGFMELLASEKVKSFVNRPHEQPMLCKSCIYRNFCGGNCKRMQKEICCSGKDNYCGYQEFLNKCGAELNNLANEIVYKNRRK